MIINWFYFRRPLRRLRLKYQLNPPKRSLIVRRSFTVQLVCWLIGWDSVVSAHTNNNIFSCLVKSNPANLDNCNSVIFSPMVCVLFPLPKAFLKIGQTRPLLVYFVLFSHHLDKYSTNLTIDDKSIDGLLGTQTRGGRMVGTDEST